MRDLIQVFKILKGKGNIVTEKYLTLDNFNYTRGNGCKIIGKRFQSNEAKHFFFNIVVNIWDTLPSNVVHSAAVEVFKRRLDKYLAWNPPLKAFGTN